MGKGGRIPHANVVLPVLGRHGESTVVFVSISELKKQKKKGKKEKKEKEKEG